MRDGGTEFRDKSGNDADGNAVHLYNYIDRYSDREDRDKRDEEGRDNSLSSKCIENNEAAKRDKDGVEETEDRARVVRTPYSDLVTWEEEEG